MQKVTICIFKKNVQCQTKPKGTRRRLENFFPRWKQQRTRLATSVTSQETKEKTKSEENIFRKTFDGPR